MVSREPRQSIGHAVRWDKFFRTMKRSSIARMGTTVIWMSSFPGRIFSTSTIKMIPSKLEAKYLPNHPQKIDLACIGNRKIAAFLHISETDRSIDRLAVLFYTQALCSSADRRKGNYLEVPARFILDDFSAGEDSCISDFDRITPVIRSREISVGVILQSLSQLRANYSHMTIINSCGHLLYLGGQDVETARYISTKANKPVNMILNVPLDGA